MTRGVNSNANFGISYNEVKNVISSVSGLDVNLQEGVVKNEVTKIPRGC